MYKFVARALLLLACGALPAAAHAQLAYAAKAVNLRAGPAPGYPVVAVVAAGVSLEVQGCLSSYSWCDVIAGPYRGWVYAGNIEYAYQGQYVPLLDYGPQLGIVIIGFTLFDYWDRYYTRQPFFRDRDRWEHYPPAPPRRPGEHRPPVRPAPPVSPVPLQPAPRAQPPYRPATPPPTQRYPAQRYPAQRYPAQRYPAQPPARALPPAVQPAPQHLPAGRLQPQPGPGPRPGAAPGQAPGQGPGAHRGREPSRHDDERPAR